MNPVSRTVLCVCCKLRTTVVQFLYMKRKLAKIFLKPLFACGSLISVQLSSVVGVNSVMYEVRSSVFVLVLVLCVEHWCPLVD